MAVHIRLRRMGAKKRAFFRIVASDSRSPRDGRFLETLGTYDPITNPARISVFEEKLSKWLDQGAAPSDTVSSLLTQIGFTEKYQKAKKGEDVADIALKTTLAERKKRTRKVKKAAIAAAESEKAAAKAKEDEAKAKAEAAAKEAEAAQAAPAEEAPAEETPDNKEE